MKPGFVFLLMLNLAACYSIQTQSWGEWTEHDPVASEVAFTASFSWADWPGMVISIDRHGDVATGYKRARLLPGKHVIGYSNHVHDFGHVSGEIQIDLVAGHSYEFHFDTCYWCKPRKYAVWVYDATNGAVVWGARPDWPGWYL